MTTTDRELIITRLIDAPRDRVFAAWTDPAQVDRWWGPRGCTSTTTEMAVRPGGVWRFVMRHAEHGELPNRVEYTEVVAPERLVYRHGSDAEPDQFRGTITFADEGGRTRLTLRAVFPSPAKLAEAKALGAAEGGDSNLDRFEELLAAEATPASTQELLITRVFRAPRALVWQAWTEAEHLTKWWGPKGFTMVAMKLDLRPGGIFHYRMRAPDGHAMGGEMWGKFVFREIVAPERLVFVNSFSDAAGDVVRAPFSPTWPLTVLNTYSFTEHDGRTTVTMRGVPFEATEAERATFVGGLASMQHGTAGMLDQLSAHLAQAR